MYIVSVEKALAIAGGVEGREPVRERVGSDWCNVFGRCARAGKQWLNGIGCCLRVHGRSEVLIGIVRLVECEKILRRFD